MSQPDWMQMKLAWEYLLPHPSNMRELFRVEHIRHQEFKSGSKAISVVEWFAEEEHAKERMDYIKAPEQKERGYGLVSWQQFILDQAHWKVEGHELETL